MNYSPLRYPGGKAKIVNFIKQFIYENYANPPFYVEMYAGGASVALGLLINNVVSEVFLNDKDRGIYCFWYSVLYDTQNFIDKIERTPIDIKNWKKQKLIFNHQEDYSILDVGFSIFYLNRCNYSGIIKANPVGGIYQTGNYKIDSRFNKENLIKRIKKIAQYKDRIKLYNKDTLNFLKEIKNNLEEAFLYLDPPYFNKGHQLYINYYKDFEHKEIANCVKDLKTHWIVSYDNTPEIIELYKFAEFREFNIPYSARNSKKGEEIMLFSSQSKIPDLDIL